VLWVRNGRIAVGKNGKVPKELRSTTYKTIKEMPKTTKETIKETRRNYGRNAVETTEETTVKITI